ncbi:hypothetical protein PCE1_003684 [Barthelona sp. PCE]
MNCIESEQDQGSLEVDLPLGRDLKMQLQKEKMKSKPSNLRKRIISTLPAKMQYVERAVEDDILTTKTEMVSLGFTQDQRQKQDEERDMRRRKRQAQLDKCRLNPEDFDMMNIDDLGEKLDDVAKLGMSILRDAKSDHYSTLQSPHLYGTLTDYQQIGFSWLSVMFDQGLSGILGDEMGLGKSVQTIALLNYMKFGVPEQNLSVIIVPVSTIENWEREIIRFAPGLNYMLYYGSQKERGRQRDFLRFSQTDAIDVIVTTYSLFNLKSDQVFFNNLSKKKPIDLLVLDEAQFIKNFTSSRFQKTKQLNSKRRLLLTGTPLSNSLLDLYTLLHFLMEHQFFMNDNVRKFFADYDGNKNVIIDKLKACLNPFLLRRLKDEVLKLPEKEEILVRIPMTPVQKSHYVEMVREHREQMQKSENNTGQTSNLMMKMRKMANHALLFHTYHKGKTDDLVSLLVQTDINVLNKIAGSMTYVDGGLLEREKMVTTVQKWSDFDISALARDAVFVHGKEEYRPYIIPDECFTTYSSKIQKLKSLVPRLVAEKHKILLYSQFTTVLDFLQYLFDAELNIKYLRIDGSTPQNQRQQRVDVFNREDSEFPVFLLSTKAAGLGINLTGADTVVFYDSDWNPSNDLQAIDRCHRMGQEKEIKVYRLVCVDSIDEIMVDRAIKKREMNVNMLEDTKLIHQVFDGDSEAQDLLERALNQVTKLENE